MSILSDSYCNWAFGEISRYGKIALEVLQIQIAQLGFQPHIHFELEGGFMPYDLGDAKGRSTLDYTAVNRDLAEHSIQGHLKPEFWCYQWEYASNFDRQTPLKVAKDLQWVMTNLSDLLKKHGAQEVYIKPVVWGGDKGRLAPECDSIFSAATESVHVPNAIQINISATDENQENIIARQGVGECLQACFLDTSRECSLLYLPEPEAFERLRLKNQFGLSRELSSPSDLSGGHQGSVALYREKGKHNQLMGEIPLLFDAKNNVISSEQEWRPLSRVEHRLGASSMLFNPYAASVFAMANLSDSLQKVYETTELTSTKRDRTHANRPNETILRELPTSLYGQGIQLGAVELFEQSRWLENKIDECVVQTVTDHSKAIPSNLGGLFKQAVLSLYRKSIARPNVSGEFV